MIIEYLRPKSIDEAVTLLERKDPKTLPLGGGTILSKSEGTPVAVVDLQALGLNGFTEKPSQYEIGATVTLCELDSFIKSSEIIKALQIQAGKNLRNSGTVAGLVCSADGRSPLLTLLLALDAQLIWEPGKKEIALGNWLPQRKNWNEAKLITKIILPKTEVRFESIARSPKDQPIICLAIAKWKNNRLRAAVGGFGQTPTLILDGNVNDDVVSATTNALKEANDKWASAEYRMEAGSKLCKRLYSELQVN